MNKRSIVSVFIFLMIVLTGRVSGQKVVESVVGIVGNDVIYLSEVESQVLQQKSMGDRTPIPDLRCRIYEDLLVQKLFLDQARIDSLFVSDENVENDLNMRLNNFIRTAGSEQKLEEYFNKSMIEIRRDLRKVIKSQLLTREMQGNIASGISVTPGDVRRFYNALPVDSLPLVGAKVEISIIQATPPDMDESKIAARQKLLDLRSRILAGESFSALAILYSEDPGSAPKGGEIGFLTREELTKPYADAAWSLNKNTVSRVIESEFGFHIIQLIDRRGEMVNTRHILIKPKVTVDQTIRASARLDSISDLIRKDSITFANAALYLSTDKETRLNGGKMVKEDPSERVNLFALEELPKELYEVVRKLKVGEISDSFRTTDSKGNTVFRIVRLDSEIPAHRVNLKDDYQELYNSALLRKQNSIYEGWITRKMATTYIKISDEYKSCSFVNKGWLK